MPIYEKPPKRKPKPKPPKVPAKMGRPRINATPEILLEKGAAFIAERIVAGKTPTINGLAIACGYTSRDSLYNLTADSDFNRVLKGLVMQVERAWEERLSENACTGAIFWLKNHGWRDQQEIKHSGSVSTEASLEYLRMSPEERAQPANRKKLLEAISGQLSGGK